MFRKDPLLLMDSSPHSPHNIISSLIKKNSVILDIGCNTGFLGRKLLEKKVTSDGIDINKKALKVAKKYYRNVYVRDLYKSHLNIGKKLYDYIIIADVLEHLPRPDLLLQDASKHLKKEGEIIISLPNVARVEIRIKLLLGNFDYTSGGILNEDHLRFFTKKTSVKMIESCNYKVINIIPTGLGQQLNILPTLTAFQFIFVCKKK